MIGGFIKVSEYGKKESSHGGLGGKATTMYLMSRTNSSQNWRDGSSSALSALTSEKH